ncbi:hypothetical protein B0J17DRAFT_630820 [Rhizoctonia solani]|nr:hypothetical protein B0J17DRAFT_630820 [Rhizoctonia solani]
MLENAKIDRGVTYLAYGACVDGLGFRATSDVEWTLVNDSKWIYVIDLDNIVFTANGATHSKLDNLSPDLDGCSYSGKDFKAPLDYLSIMFNLWPTPRMRYLEENLPFGTAGDRELTEYFWARDCLVALCAWLGGPAYAAYEVVQMVPKFKVRRNHRKATQSLGIILLNRHELIELTF